MSAEPIVRSYLDAGHADAAIRRDVAEGLGHHPRSIPPTWFYDDRGSELFERITRLPEYYQTEAERSILADRAAEIASVSGADTLVELGSGAADKTRTLLDGLRAAGALRRFVPFDVSEGILRSSSADIAADYPGLEIEGVVGDFTAHLDRIPTDGRRLIAFLGGTIGNFDAKGRADLLRPLVASMDADDTFLLGTDLVKDPRRLVRAYDDSAGVTAEFNRNVLAVVNRELDADFDLSAFEHVARWNEREEWIEMWLRCTRSHDVRLEALDLDVRFEAGEEIHTEISAKFRRESLVAELASLGLRELAWWTDAPGDYAVSLWSPHEI